MFSEISIDLSRPLAARWNLSADQCGQARELLAFYQRDLGMAADAVPLICAAARDRLAPSHLAEIESLAAQAGVPCDLAMLGNLYYDVLKAVWFRAFGCTAFAIDTPEGPLHARNLDWWTGNAALARYTAICRFTGAPAGGFTSVGWPGLAGVFSAVAPGRFAVTLNAVLSEDDAQLACPVVFLLRTVLESAPDFAAALRVLAETPIASDCLLLLTGTRRGEMAVIERTPSRSAVRHPEHGFIAVTNGYQALAAEGHAPGALSTWCGRSARIHELAAQRRPRTPDECFACLRDDRVQMGITVQQMVFHAASPHFSHPFCYGAR
jgi:acid ceramidase